MAWNGSGIFQRLYNWVTDRDASIPITASRMDAEMDGVATGITACLAKNGENSPTADLPMGGYKHSNVGLANARTMYSRADQVQDNSLIYSTDSGTANSYIISVSPPVTSYVTGQIFIFMPSNSNTGASTVDVNSVGATTIVTEYGSALPANAIVANQIAIIIYDGTNFALVSYVNTAALAAVSAVTSAANKIIRFTGSGTADTIDYLDEDDMASDSPSAVASQQSVKSYVDTEISTIGPIGSIVAWPNSTAPTNYLECDGSTFSAGTYPDLNTVLGGTTLPDLRGEWIRGWDNSRGVDSGRSLLSTQAEQLSSHNHLSPKSQAGTSGTQAPYGTGTGTSTSIYTGHPSGSATTTLYQTSSTGGSELRPRNIALMYIIRAL